MYLSLAKGKSLLWLYSVWNKTSRLCIVYYLKTKRIIIGLMAAPTGREGPKMELRLCVHISEKKAHLHKFRILHESSTFAGFDGTQQ